MKDSKTINLIAEKLNSKNTEEVLFAINQIRNLGEPKILPHAIELLNKKTNPEVEMALICLLNDLKIQAGTIEIITALKNKKYIAIQKQLLASCWQSGLNYCEHLDFFIDLFISGDFEIAFEAFTIIENMERQLTSEKVDALIKKLKNDFSIIKGEKADLLLELVHVLENMKV